MNNEIIIIRNCWISARGAIKFHPSLQHKLRGKRGMHAAEGEQFYCPSHTYLAIVLLALYHICLTMEQLLIQVASEVRQAY